MTSNDLQVGIFYYGFIIKLKLSFDVHKDIVKKN